MLGFVVFVRPGFLMNLTCLVPSIPGLIAAGTGRSLLLVQSEELPLLQLLNVP